MGAHDGAVWSPPPSFAGYIISSGKSQAAWPASDSAWMRARYWTAYFWESRNADSWAEVTLRKVSEETARRSQRQIARIVPRCDHGNQRVTSQKWLPRCTAVLRRRLGVNFERR